MNYDNTMYSKINIFDDVEEENEIKYKSIFPIIKTDNNNKNIKNKILKKLFFEKLTLFKCLFLLLMILLFVSILIELTVNYNTKYIHDIRKVLQNIVNSNSMNNITEKKLDINDKKENNKEEETHEEDNEKEEGEPNKPKVEDIYKEEVFDSLNEAFNKAKDFLDKCMKGVLMHNKPFISIEKPRVSAVIPLYNSKNYISRAIKSIQNQNILDIEIVLVNDCSTDDTLSFVEKIQTNDPRIKIVNNKKKIWVFYILGV
jgi:regulator of replication initiation timing